MSDGITLPSTTVALPQPCPYCSTQWSGVYHGGPCPRVSEIEYYPDGSVKRVRFGFPPA